MDIPIPLLSALQLGTPLGAEVPASRPERLAGVTISPLGTEEDDRAEWEGWKPSIVDREFLVVWREYSREYIEQQWDMVPGYGLWEIQRARIAGEQALQDLLRSWDIPPASLTYLWNTPLPE